MTRLGWISLALISAGAIAGVAMTVLTPEVHLERVDVPQAAATEQTGMCPWRSPESDMQAFFPGATSYRNELLILSDLRLDVLRRLAPGDVMESNGLYVYRVFAHSKFRGAVVVQRAAGEYGAVEMVVGVRPDYTIAGVRMQRMREPDATAKAITSSSWLGAFRGKTAKSAFRIGDDLPKVPASAQTTANTVARSIRTLLIEYDTGEHRPGLHHADPNAPSQTLQGL